MNTKDASEKSTILRGDNLDYVLYCVAAFFMPSIPLLDLYNRNHAANDIVFWHVIIVAVLLAVTGVLLFLLFRWIIDSLEGALLLVLIFWLCFWLFKSLYGVTVGYSIILSSAGMLILLGLGIVFMAVCFRRYKPPFSNIRPVFNVLAISLVVLFIFNLIPAVNHEMILVRGRSEREDKEEGELFYIKRDFRIDPRLPNPDIYWLHLDGMLSLEMMERFSYENLEWLRDEVTGRGFLIYENAFLNAGYTSAALPALLSPSFYDSFWSEQLTNAERESRHSREHVLVGGLAQAGLEYADLVSSYEMFSAFHSKGYEFDIRNTIYGRIPENVYHLTDGYAYILGRWHYFDRFLSSDLPKLLSLTTPLTFPLGTYRIPVELSRTDNYLEPNLDNFPRLIWNVTFFAHASRWYYQEDPTLPFGSATTRIDLYPLAFQQATQWTLNQIDLILEENPYAVIVLQSDHGFHLIETQQYLLDQGYSLDQVLELIHSVFSAVRIPPEYGGLDEPIAPLNISRELVNRFVGENYTLLTEYYPNNRSREEHP